jgi:hypothetical protein
METPVASIQTLVAKAEQFGKTSIELCKLKAIHKSADIISSVAVRLTILAISILCILAFTTGLALWFGELCGKTYYGFFIIAGVYAFAGTLIFVFRNRWIKTPVQNSIVSKALN